MKKSRINHRGARIGDMRHRVYLHDRSISPPVFGSVDFDQLFVGNPRWAAVKTFRGKTVFDGVSRDENVTHEVFMRYEEGITSESFLQLSDGQRLRVLAVENYEERGEYVVLMCTNRGLDEAAKA